MRRPASGARDPAIEKSRRVGLARIYLASLGVLALSAVLWSLLGASYRANLLARERAELRAVLSDAGSQLTSVINRRQALLTGLVAFVDSHMHDADLRADFALYASGLKGNDPAIRVIQIFPPEGAMLLYPEAGNEAIQGLGLADLLADERPNVGIDLRRTIASRRITLSDPYVLRQGGLGVLARQAIYRSGTFWGLASIALDIEALLELAGIPSDGRLSEVALEDRAGRVFYGDPASFGRDAVQVPVALPEGTWILSVPVPASAYARVRATLLPFWILSVLLSLSPAAATLVFGLRQLTLSGEVLDRIRERDASAKEFSLLFDQTAEAVLGFDATGRCQAANPGVCAILGVDREALLGRDARSLLGLEADGRPLPWELADAGGLIPLSLHRLSRADGELVELEFIWHWSPGGGAQGLGRDVTKRHLAEAQARSAQAATRKQLELAERSRLALLGLAEDRELAVARLRSSEELLHETGQMARVGGWEYDLGTGRATWTAEAAWILGVDAGLGREFDFTVLPLSPESLARLDAAGRRALETGEDWDLELDLALPGGKRIWIRSIGRAVSENGKVTRLLGSFQDISDIREVLQSLRKAQEEVRTANASLEARVAERTAQLEYANRELEAFTYSVSHDLRAPLRAIDGFSRFLLEDYAERLDEEGLRLLAVVRKNTLRMEELISGLLNLSRVARNELRRGTVDMEALVRAVWEESGEPSLLSTFELRIDPLPSAWGDSSLLRQVWANLLSNAIKYSSKSPCRRIEIKADAEPASTVYHVEDSGVGFDPEYADKLFGVFQRLHDSDQYEGNGVGLAIVQRIVARHGGRIWAEGRPGRGASFHFELPLREGSV